MSVVNTILSQFLAAYTTYHLKKYIYIYLYDLNYSCVNLTLKHIFIVY